MPEEKLTRERAKGSVDHRSSEQAGYSLEVSGVHLSVLQRDRFGDRSGRNHKSRVSCLQRKGGEEKMIKVENHEVTMFGELEELSAEITLLMATHYQAMVRHWGEEKANQWLASMGRYAVSPDALEGVKSYEEHVIPVVKK